MAFLDGADAVGPGVVSRKSEPVPVIPFGPSERRPDPDPSPLALIRLIEGEIIPRLLLAHQPNAIAAAASTPTARALAASEVTLFAQMVLSEELDGLLRHVDGFLDRGVGVEDIYFGLLSPAAKLLGVMWEEDVCSFTDVTVGLCRLQQIVYDLSARTPPAEAQAVTRSALFALTPGDQHAFGLVLVAEFFRRAGWRTVSAPDASARGLADLVSRESFDVIGFSMSDEQWLTTLPGVISSLRIASRNPLVRVIVGGRVFSDRPWMAAQVGADATAADAHQALQCAETLVDPPVYDA